MYQGSSAPMTMFLSPNQHQQLQQLQQSHNEREGTVTTIPDTVPLQDSSSRPSAALIQQIQEIAKQVATRMEQLRWQQKQTSLPIQAESFFALDKEQKELKAAIEWSEKQLNGLLDNVILESSEMHVLLQLQLEVFLQQKQLELFIQELQGFQKDNALPR